jgi:hypothetical protein
MLKPEEMFVYLGQHANSRAQTSWNLIPSNWVAMDAPPRERALSCLTSHCIMMEDVKVK